MKKVILSSAMLFFVGIAISNAQTESTDKKVEGKSCSKTANMEGKKCCSKGGETSEVKIEGTDKTANVEDKTAKTTKSTAQVVASERKKAALKKETE